MKAHHGKTPLNVSASSRLLRLQGARSRCTRGIQRFALVVLLTSPASSCLSQSLQPAEPSAAQSSRVPPAAASQTPPTPAAPPSSSIQAPPTIPPASSAIGGPASSVDNSRYVIGADDNLQITVWREPSLSGVLPVRPDGMISLVLIGDLRAAGRTPSQLSSDITERLKKYIQDPSVTVAVTAVNSQRIYMVGEVGHVGPVAMTPGMTPLQAISAAGGPSPYANLKRIYILRGQAAKQQKLPFNYKQALKGDNRQDITLQPGDTIVVP